MYSVWMSRWEICVVSSEECITSLSVWAILRSSLSLRMQCHSEALILWTLLKWQSSLKSVKQLKCCLQRTTLLFKRTVRYEDQWWSLVEKLVEFSLNSVREWEFSDSLTVRDIMRKLWWRKWENEVFNCDQKKRWRKFLTVVKKWWKNIYLYILIGCTPLSSWSAYRLVILLSRFDHVWDQKATFSFQE